jgi:hypothetical protein
MEERQKLHIELGCSIPDFISCLEKHLQGDWVRSKEIEKGNHLKPTSSLERQRYCFVQIGAHSPAHVWLCQRTPTLLCSDVIPASGRFTYQQHNRALQRFVRQVVTSAAGESGATYYLSPDSWEPEDILSELPAKKFRALFRSSIKVLPDGEDWHDFLIEVHLAGWEMTTGQLERWLSEEKGFSDKNVTDMTVEYEFAHGLLRAYDKRLIAQTGGGTIPS